MPRKKSKEPKPTVEPAATQPAGAELVTGDDHGYEPSFAVVGIGASAGGLDAFKALFTALPADTGLGFVLIPHLSPTHTSSLGDILSRFTRMPVAEVAGEARVEPNHVYVIPPGREMIIAEGKLRLQARAPNAPQRAIDQFFRSLAQDQEHRAIGVILSGTATDGTLGLTAIKEAGGIAFAQDDTAEQTGMPHSAIAKGSVDFVLPPHLIAQELVRIAKHPPVPPAARSSAARAESEFGPVLKAVRQATGIDFTHYKANTLHRRIMRRMILKKTSNLDEYLKLLVDLPGEVEALRDDLLIGVTSFFRNPDAFEKLKTAVFPKLTSSERGLEPVRIWVLGCSTGEEAYSLAIAFAEYADTLKRRVPVQIFASDVNAGAIDKARAGAYNQDIAQDVSPERLRRFFVEVGGRYQVVKSIRDMCVFSQHNVLVDPPFSRIDFISCRNLLMYLESVLQQQVIPILYYALKPTGLLWLGSAETIVGSLKDLFETEDGRHRIFAKKPGTAPHVPLYSMRRRERQLDRELRAGEPREMADLLKEGDRLLLARFAPAGVLVTASMEIVQFRGDLGPYVSPVPGAASLSLLRMLGLGLQTAVRGAVLRAKREESPVRDEAVQVRSEDGSFRTVTIEVIPVRAGKDGFIVLFEEPGTYRPGRDTTRQTAGARRKKGGADSVGDEIARLSKDLVDTRDYLQSVIEQQEAAHEKLQSAHEEVQSANEELQSINEELETSKEEVHSSNEELTTVNDELQHRNDELARTSADLINLLTSTEQAVVFVGRDLHIRRYTPLAESVLSLIPSDVGRTIRDVRLTATPPNLEQLLMTVIATSTGSDHEVQNDQGRWYSMRIRPYKSLNNQIDGAVLVLVDVDVVTRARLYAESIIATVREPLLVLDGQIRIVSANAAFYRTFDVDPAQTEGRCLYELGDGQWDVPVLRELLEKILPQNNVFVDFEVVHDFPRIGRRAMMLNSRRLEQAPGATPLILLAIEDVTELRHAEGLRRQRVAELAAADQSKNEFLAMLAHELRNPLAPIRTAAQILELPGAPASATDKARVILDRQIETMIRLIDDLLDVARITQGKIELRKRRVDLTAILQRAVELVQDQVAQRGQALTQVLLPHPVHVSGDATRLEQVFGNLLSNASKFTPEGGHIFLRMDSGDTSDAAHGGHGGHEVTVRVKDDGIGVAPEVLPYVFDLFKQAGESPHHARGMGVGLSLVHRIVTMHGGRIEARSDSVNQGTEFAVSLPSLAPSDRTDEPEEPEPPRLDDSVQVRILVADDNSDAAESLGDLLRLRHHDVRVVNDGASVLAMAATFHPQIAFVAIDMPKMDGYEIAERLRANPETAAVYLVALTGFGRDEDRQHAIKSGFDRHVTKPLDPAVLSSLLAGFRDREER